MTGDSKNWQARPDDIDLLALLERSLLFFRRNRWIFLTCMLLGLLLGFLKYVTLPAVYKSRMILSSSLLSNQNYIQMVTTWNALLKSDEETTLATIFNTSAEVLHNLKQIKGEEIQKIFSAHNPNGFIIDVWVTDLSKLDSVQKGILYGFDNSDYSRDRLNAKRAKLQELMEKTSSEINRLDSVKKIMENIIMGTVTSSSSLIVDGSTVSRQLVDLNEKLLNIKEELKFTNAVQVVQSFSKFHKPAGPNIYKWLLLGLITGLGLAYLISIFRSLEQKLLTRANLQVRA